MSIYDFHVGCYLLRFSYSLHRNLPSANFFLCYHAVVCAYIGKTKRLERKTKAGVVCLEFYFVCFNAMVQYDDMLFYSEGYLPRLVVWMLSFWKIVWAPNHRKRRRKKVNSWSLLRKPKFLCQGLENNPEKLDYIWNIQIWKQIINLLLTISSEEPSSNTKKAWFSHQNLIYKIWKL